MRLLKHDILAKTLQSLFSSRLVHALRKWQRAVQMHKAAAAEEAMTQRLQALSSESKAEISHIDTVHLEAMRTA